MPKTGEPCEFCKKPVSRGVPTSYGKCCEAEFLKAARAGQARAALREGKFPFGDKGQAVQTAGLTPEEIREMELVESRAKLKEGMPTEGLFVLVGLPKSAKTTLAASFPGSYVLELEKG